MKRLTKVGFLVMCPALALTLLSVSDAATPPPQKIKGFELPNNVLLVDWDELLPPNSGGHAADLPPPPVHSYLGESAPAAKQSGSAAVNPDLEGLTVRIPGFIVPLDQNAEGLVTEFFLVPYFGACIHVPPPPPNQIVYVKPAKPFEIKDITDAYWITGLMHVVVRRNQLAASSYSMSATKIEVYK